MGSYKDKYKSIQLNLLKEKHRDLIEWLENLSDEEERSLNSIIIHILKRELKRSKGEGNE